MKTEKLRTFPGDLALRQQLAQNVSCKNILGVIVHRGRSKASTQILA